MSEDLAFVLDSWGSSFYDGVKVHKRLSPDEFHAFHRPIRERFFSKPNTAVIVCHPDDDPWLIMAWIAVEQIPSGLILHYLYVKSAFKLQGLADQLIGRTLSKGPVFFSHLTDRASKIMAQNPKFQSWRYIPHLV